MRRAMTIDLILFAKLVPSLFGNSSQKDCPRKGYQLNHRDMFKPTAMPDLFDLIESTAAEVPEGNTETHYDHATLKT